MATKLVLSGWIGHYKISEEVVAAQQLNEVVSTMKKLGKKALLFVYDREYPSDRFIDQHIKR